MAVSPGDTVALGAGTSCGGGSAGARAQVTQTGCHGEGRHPTDPGGIQTPEPALCPSGHLDQRPLTSVSHHRGMASPRGPFPAAIAQPPRAAWRVHAWLTTAERNT